MVGEAIRGILDGGARKVIIPGCGTFIRRESGEFVFTELLRTDDGKLTAALAASRDIAPEAARKLVESYAAALNRELAETGRATVEGIGTIVRTAAGSYTVEPQNGTVPQKADSEPARQTERDIPATTDALTEDGAAQTADASRPADTDAEERPQDTLSGTGQEEVAPHEEVRQEADNAPAPTYGRYDKSRLRSALYGDREPDDEEPAEQRRPLSQSLPDTTPSAAQAATPAAAAPTPVSSGDDEKTEYTPQIHIRRPGKPKKRPDAVLVIAIIAFAIAIGVLVYGFLANRDINAVKEGILIEMDDSGQPAEPAAEAE